MIIHQESYQHIKDLLKKYKFKISLLPGNHDDFTLIKSLQDDQISIGNIDLSNA
jgi:3',5'-cyclic AMP phosphodiesterase CpdA